MENYRSLRRGKRFEKGRVSSVAKVFFPCFASIICCSIGSYFFCIPSISEGWRMGVRQTDGHKRGWVREGVVINVASKSFQLSNSVQWTGKKLRFALTFHPILWFFLRWVESYYSKIILLVLLLMTSIWLMLQQAFFGRRKQQTQVQWNSFFKELWAIVGGFIAPSLVSSIFIFVQPQKLNGKGWIYRCVSHCYWPQKVTFRI